MAIPEKTRQLIAERARYTKVQGTDPVTNETVPLFQPRRQRWRDQFCWSDDGVLVIGLTPTGRATVDALHLNRPGLVKLRRILFNAGEHPPKRTDRPSLSNSPARYT